MENKKQIFVKMAVQTVLHQYKHKLCDAQRNGAFLDQLATEIVNLAADLEQETEKVLLQWD